MKVGEVVTRIRNNEALRVTEILLLNQMVFYRVERSDGTLTLVADNMVKLETTNESE